MNMSFYTAALGAKQQQQRMNVQANNIANVNTFGYKAKKPSFSALMYSTVGGIDGAELPKGTGTRMIMAGTDFREGATRDTGRSLDYAILGRGFFALVDPTTQEISYTRDGSFTMSQFQRPNMDGEMETVYMLGDGDGRFVLSDEGRTIEISDPDAPQPVGVFDFVNTDGMLHAGANRFVPVGKNGQVRYGEGTARQGVLEASNTDLADELTKVIEAQRSYGYALKMVQTSDEVESTINGLRG